MIENLYKLMTMTDLDIHHKNITINNKGETFLYVKALNAIYGIMKAVVLFYKKFVVDKTTIGFKINPHDRCVTNS